MENRPGLTAEAELLRAEERISKKNALELITSKKLDDMAPGSFATLQYIHKYLFSGVYPSAGEIRKVNISKGNMFFAPLRFLDQNLQAVEDMPSGTFEQIVEKYVEMNILHPFRDGNGRSMRIWLDHMFEKRLGKVTDWTKISKEDYLSAMKRSPVRDVEIKHLLKNALVEPSDKLDFLSGNIDASYFYEGYNYYSLKAR